ncbi:unnamed protein product [Adineta ricciae]|uniref:Uncharacterized protein n=2 Tax=Adineta ricciae TaxID=249248 RepID=A0A815KSK8_ADIRI|nr:unnamed protein product [Adineta ricciae]
MPSSTSTTHQFTRNASCPSQGTLSSKLTSRKYSSSTNTLHYCSDSTVPTETGATTASKKENNRNILQRIKTGVVNFFKQISNDNVFKPVEIQQSTFVYDPELDLREEHISLISKRLLTALRESKIKHLSCDNLFLPCNHLRNIAKQCLIMAAEEPFGIMGAQIRIKLTSLSTNLTSTTTKYLPLIRINPKQKTVFEIEIDLHEDTKVFTLRRLLPEMKLFRQLKEKSPLYVSPRCLLVKNVFYKTAEPKRAIIDT